MPTQARFFVDEDSLGLGKALAQRRQGVVYPEVLLSHWIDIERVIIDAGRGPWWYTVTATALTRRDF